MVCWWPLWSVCFQWIRTCIYWATCSLNEKMNTVYTLDCRFRQIMYNDRVDGVTLAAALLCTWSVGFWHTWIFSFHTNLIAISSIELFLPFGFFFMVDAGIFVMSIFCKLHGSHEKAYVQNSWTTNAHKHCLNFMFDHKCACSLWINCIPYSEQISAIAFAHHLPSTSIYYLHFTFFFLSIRCLVLASF